MVSYSTMADKVAAYADFFKSETPVLVVVGAGGSGKSEALAKLKVHDAYGLITDRVPTHYHAQGDDTELTGISRTIYHLLDTDEELAQALKKKYNACLIRFERGLEEGPKKKELVDFMDEIEFFYVGHRDDRSMNGGLLDVEWVRRTIYDLLKALDAAPRVSR